MATIPHRQLRNESSKILERVKNSETINVTNNGDIAATLIPPSLTAFDRMMRAGAIRPAIADRVDFRSIRRVSSAVTTASTIDDLRGDR